MNTSAPVDVRVQMDDGTEVAVECMVMAVDDDRATWEVVTPLPGKPVGMTCAMLPASVSIRLPLDPSWAVD